AHELGTPLAVVDGMAQRLVRKGTPEGGEIREAVSRMSGIVRQLLEFGARESGDWRTVSARSLLVGAMGAVRGEAARTGVAVEPLGAVSSALVRGDQPRLESALVHLLRNAVQAAGPEGSIRASADVDDDVVRFRVEDTGPGVPEEVRTRLFEPFYTTKPVGEGAGLGLAVVHAVAEEHAGRVDVDRSSLGGARFTLTIPREGGDG
ncbi:MAG TPA: HAMP domain-containing sensor histidine kinase, partial [Longimicrobiales bacterium]|nr:HAMP domain-containing sensor histidine kinase [Longimicrobiales bacterium]